MKHALLCLGVSVGIFACASAPKPEPVASTSSALTAPSTGEPTSSAAPKADAPSADATAIALTKAKAAGDGADKGASASASASASRGDPLAVDASLEAAAVPKIVFTPKNKLRGKSRADLDAAIGVVKTAQTVDQAAKRIEARIGKPTWIENGNRRVWVAVDGNKCHRLVLDSDGQVDVETADKTERRMLSALAKQNPCTGEILREGL